MKKILYADSYKEVREFLQEEFSRKKNHYQFEVTFAVNLEEALKLFDADSFDGLILDGLQVPMDKILRFVETVRNRNPELPIIAMVSGVDLHIKSEERTEFLNAKVSVVNKVSALSTENISAFFNSVFTRGLGRRYAFREAFSFDCG